jgi:hypothetical protein
MEDANSKGAVKSPVVSPRDVQPDRGRIDSSTRAFFSTSPSRGRATGRVRRVAEPPGTGYGVGVSLFIRMWMPPLSTLRVPPIVGLERRENVMVEPPTDTTRQSPSVNRNR